MLVVVQHRDADILQALYFRQEAVGFRPGMADEEVGGADGDIHIEIRIQPLPGAPEKANLIATLGRGPGGLVLSGHTDTVPYDEHLWQFSPFDVTERDDRSSVNGPKHKRITLLNLAPLTS